MWCRHKLEEVERFYDKVTGLTKLSIGEADPDEIAKLLLGVTSILYQCRKCGYPKTIEILGKSMRDDV